MIRNLILCGTDFSEAGIHAAEVAAGLARKTHSTLLLVHAASPDQISGEPSAIQTLIDAESAQLHKLAESLRSEGTSVDEAIGCGRAPAMLVELAAERRARMIVVGAVGRTRRLLMGSTAVRVAESAPVPTLVVRQGRRVSDWIGGKSCLRVVVADDFSPAGDAALRLTARWCELGRCEVAVAHVNWPVEDRRRLKLHGPVSLTENAPELQRALETKLAERTGKHLRSHKCTLHVVPCWGRPDAYLLNLASESRADLIVIGTHQRRTLERFRLGSVSRALLKDALVNVLVVPRPAARAIKSAARVDAPAALTAV